MSTPEHLATAFFEISESVFEAMASLRLTFDPARSESCEGLGGADVRVTLELSGPSSGLFVLAFSEKLARRLVAGMLEMSEAELDPEDVLDGARELANVVAGGAKACLEQQGHRYTLGVPTSVDSADAEIVWPDYAGRRIGGVVEGEPFEIAVWLSAEPSSPSA
ncbi:MAG: chemotaxis protein CheX [Myxococcota bacterium]